MADVQAYVNDLMARVGVAGGTLRIPKNEPLRLGITALVLKKALPKGVILSSCGCRGKLEIRDRRPK